MGIERCVSVEPGMCVMGFGVAAAAAVAISLSVHLDLKGAHRGNFHFCVFIIQVT